MLLSKRMPQLAVIYPHTVEGSLGSYRRAKELLNTLHVLGRGNLEINVYTPFHERLVKKDGIDFIPISKSYPRLDFLYQAAKSAYYHPFFSRTILPEALSFFSKIQAKTLIRLLKNNPPAVIQAEDVSLPIAVAAGKALKIPVVVDIHNIPAEELVASRALERGNSALARIQSSYGSLLRKCDLVVVVSDLMKKYVLQQYSLNSNDVLVVPPAGKTDVPTMNGPFLKKVVFAGTVSYRERVDLFVESIRHIQPRLQPRFYITARGDLLNDISNSARKHHIDLKKFWFPEEDDFFRFLSSCSIGILTSSDDLARRIGTPVKLFDYMSVGLPVVCNDVGAWSRLISQERVGMLTSDDPIEIAGAISSLLQDPDIMAKISKRQLRLVKEKCNWRNSVLPLFEWYRRKGFF